MLIWRRSNTRQRRAFGNKDVAGFSDLTQQSSSHRQQAVFVAESERPLEAWDKRAA